MSLMYLVGMFTEPVELVAALFAGTCNVSKECLLLPKILLFVVCDTYDALLEGSMKNPVEVYDLHLLNSKLDLKESEATFSARKIFFSPMEELIAK